MHATFLNYIEQLFKCLNKCLCNDKGNQSPIKINFSPWSKTKFWNVASYHYAHIYKQYNQYLENNQYILQIIKSAHVKYKYMLIFIMLIYSNPSRAFPFLLLIPSAHKLFIFNLVFRKIRNYVYIMSSDGWLLFAVVDEIFKGQTVYL